MSCRHVKTFPFSTSVFRWSYSFSENKKPTIMSLVVEDPKLRVHVVVLVTKKIFATSVSKRICPVINIRVRVKLRTLARTASWDKYRIRHKLSIFARTVSWTKYQIQRNRAILRFSMNIILLSRNYQFSSTTF